MNKKMKLCWWCKHFYYAEGSPGYSEMTPGDNMSMSCDKKHWEFNSMSTSEEEFRNNLMMAETCKDYSLKLEV